MGLEPEKNEKEMKRRKLNLAKTVTFETSRVETVELCGKGNSWQITREWGSSRQCLGRAYRDRSLFTFIADWEYPSWYQET